MTTATAPKLPKRKMKFIERKLDGGMGMAVAKRTYLRRITDAESGRERWENWAEVAHRVALGNSLLAKKDSKHQKAEYEVLKKHISNGSV